MLKKNELSPEAFKDLLDWLDRDSEIAAEKYETIRYGLIRYFERRNCTGCEDLADIVFDRVAVRLDKIRAEHTGDPAPLFYGFARHVAMEYHRRPQSALLSDDIPLGVPEKFGDAYTHLAECLEKLPNDERELILEYYLDTKDQKIARRKALADSLKITSGALRTKAHRIRAILEKCVKKCLALLKK